MIARSSRDFEHRLRGFDTSRRAMADAAFSNSLPSPCFLFSQLFWRSLKLHPSSEDDRMPYRVGGERKRGWSGMEYAVTFAM